MSLEKREIAPTWPPINVGTEVVTTEANDAVEGWTQEALDSRRWGIAGLVIAQHDSHGLSYEVQHGEDRSIGHYDPSELEVVSNS